MAHRGGLVLRCIFATLRTQEITEAERKLQQLGWFEGRGSGIARFITSGNDDPDVPILPSTVVWERIGIADGRVGLLVTNEAVL